MTLGFGIGKQNIFNFPWRFQAKGHIEYCCTVHEMILTDELIK